MTFDLISILFVISINYLFVSIFLFWNWIANRQYFKGLLNWAIAYTLVAIVFTLQFLRAAIPELFSVVFSNTILITSYIIILDGVRRFRELRFRPYKDYLLIPIVAVLFYFFTYIQPNTNSRILIIQSALIIVTTRIILILIKKVSDNLKKTYSTVALLYSISGIFFFIRILYTLTQPTAKSYSASGNIQFLLVIFLTTLSILQSLGLIMMVNTRYKVLQIDLVKQKELLIKETHHRIKNNFASIGAILQLKTNSTTNSEVLSVLNDTTGRVTSMQVLYENMLHTDDYNLTSVKDYLDNLVTYIVSLSPEDFNLTIKKQFTDFQLDSVRQISLGIIVNELLTNIFKYAFTGKDSGLIQITLEKKNRDVTLIIQDDGNGLPENFILEEQKGFGLMLIDSYSKQLDGSFTMVNNNGTKSILEFPI